ncbi:MAG: glycosyltransferase family 4 protein [Myxococcales bacterium]|nr:glycosyltransferase family 4 protein [Myxococcales bacterium]
MTGPRRRLHWALTHAADRAISFNFQAARVTAALARAGWEVIILAPGETPVSDEWTSGGRRVLSLPKDPDGASVRRLFEAEGAEHVVYLGHPDQLPWLADLAGTGVTVWWWAQASSARSLGLPPEGVPYRAVPLTPKSREHLLRWAAPPGSRARVTAPIPHAVAGAAPVAEGERRDAKRLHGCEGRFVVGSVGVHTARKQLPRLLGAYAAVERTLPEAMLLLKTTAEAKDGGPNLRTLASALGIRNLTIEEGRRTEGEMRRLYVAMDLYVHAAEWEGFGIPVAEAMAHGVPALVPRSQGPGEWVPDARFRIDAAETIPSNERDPEASPLVHVDPAALAARILALARNPAERNKMSATARDHAARRFAPEVVAGLWTRVLLEG